MKILNIILLNKCCNQSETNMMYDDFIQGSKLITTYFDIELKNMIKTIFLNFM